MSLLPPEWGRSAVEWRAERDKVRLFRPPAHDNVADVAAQMRENERRQPEVVLINGAHIEPQPVRWLWRNHLQRGSLNLLAGKSATGKSTVALSFAATITSGGPWPDGQVCEAEQALFWSGEDDVRTTLLPRFIAAGGERDNIGFIEGVRDDGKKRPFNPAADMPVLERAIAKIGGKVGLIVLDPIAVVVKGDSHKNVETRVGLQPFCDLCAAVGAAGLGVHHFTKNTSGGDPLERVSGSLAFGALPRAILVAARDENDADDPRRALLRAKVSNGPDWGGFAYSLERRELDGYPGIEAQRVLWGGPIEGTTRDILAKFEEKRDDRPAMVFLREALKGGPRLAAEVIAEAALAGIPKRTLQRALNDMGGTTERHGVGRDHFTVWELPRLDA
jgi:putative DNA primase/helicase